MSLFIVYVQAGNKHTHTMHLRYNILFTPGNNSCQHKLPSAVISKCPCSCWQLLTTGIFSILSCHCWSKIFLVAILSDFNLKSSVLPKGVVDNSLRNVLELQADIQVAPILRYFERTYATSYQI